MQNVSALNHTIGKAIMQEISPDPRNIATFMVAVTSLLASKSVQLAAWISCISGTTKAGSRIRRFARWLADAYINPYEWYGPIFRHAMQTWTQMPIFFSFGHDYVIRLLLLCTNIHDLYESSHSCSLACVGTRQLVRKIQILRSPFRASRNAASQGGGNLFSGRQRFCVQGFDAPPPAVKVDLAYTSER